MQSTVATLIRGALKRHPAELTQPVGIHQAQQRFTAGKQRLQAQTALLLQTMQALGQSKGQQGFALAALTDRLPASGLTSLMKSLKA